MNLAKLETHLNRWIRIIAFSFAASPAATHLASSWSARVPILGAGIGLLEVAYRAFVSPTVPAGHTAPPSPQTVELTTALNALAELLSNQLANTTPPAAVPPAT